MSAMTSDVPRSDLNIFGGKTVRNLSPLGGIPLISTQMPNASLRIVEFKVLAGDIKAIELPFQEM
jgi:hypothetical protein